MKYTIELVYGDVAESTVDNTEREPVGEPKAPNPNITKKLAKGLATVTVIYALASNGVVSYLNMQNRIKGDSVAQRRLANTMAYINESVGLFGSIAGGALIAGPIGVATALAGQALKYAVKAVNLTFENTAKQAEWQANREALQYKTQRLVKDMQGVRI